LVLGTQQLVLNRLRIYLTATGHALSLPAHQSADAAAPSDGRRTAAISPAVGPYAARALTVLRPAIDKFRQAGEAV
jgi:hypothetical protein